MLQNDEKVFAGSYSSPKLSERLQVAANWVLPNKDLADLCCDHGYLGLWAFKAKGCPKVHFVDKSSEVIAKLKGQWQNFNLPFEFMAKGGEELNPKELLGTVVIMGVGSQTVINILEAWRLQCDVDEWKMDRLVLGAHTKLDKLENYLVQLGLMISEKVEVVERKRARQLWRIDCKTSL